MKIIYSDGRVEETLPLKPVQIEVTRENITWVTRLLIKYRKLTEVKQFEIPACTLESSTSISKELLKIGSNVYIKNNVLENLYKADIDYSPTLSKVIAIAITRKDNPPKRLQKFLLKNLSRKDLIAMTEIVIKQMDLPSLIQVLYNVKGINILEPWDTLGTKEDVEHAYN
jgi:hypothetical protein